MAVSVTVRDNISQHISFKLTQIAQNANAGAAGVMKLNTAMRSVSGNNFAAAAGGMAKIQSSASATGTSFVTAGRAVRGFMSGLLLIGAFFAAFRGVDTYQIMENQIRQTTRSQAELNAVMGKMFDIANRTRVPVGDLGKLYRRVDTALARMGVSGADSLIVTESIAGMLTLSGVTAQEASSAMLQLSQAFNKGKLDGDEFRTVAELMPAVLIAISDSLGISIAEVFKWSKEGKISAKVMADAFVKESGKIKKALELSPQTVGQSWTVLKNKVTQAFGEPGGADDTLGITNGLVSGLQLVSNNIYTVIAAVTALGTAFAAVQISSIVSGFSSLVAAGAGIAGLTAGAVALGAAIIAAGVAWALFSNQTSEGAISAEVHFKTFISLLKNDLTNAIQSAKSSIQEFFNSPTQQRGQAELPGSGDLFDDINDGVIAARAGILALWEYLQTFAGFLGGELAQAGAGIWNQFIDATAAAVQAVSDAIETMTRMINDFNNKGGITRQLKNKGLDILGAGGDLIGQAGLGDAVRSLKDTSKVLQADVSPEIQKNRDNTKTWVDNIKALKTEVSDINKLNEKGAISTAAKASAQFDKTFQEEKMRGLIEQEEQIQKIQRAEQARRDAEKTLRGPDPEKAAEVQRQLDLMSQDTKALNREHDKMVEKLTEAARGWQNILGTVENVAASLKGVNASEFNYLSKLTKQRGDAAINARVGEGGFTTENSPFTKGFIGRAEIGSYFTSGFQERNPALAGGAGAGQDFQQEISAAQQAAETIKQAFAEAASAASASLSSINSSGFAAIGTAATTAGQAITTAFSSVATVITGIVQSITGLTSGISSISTAANSASSAISSISTAAGTAAAGVSAMATSAVAQLQAVEQAAIAAAAAVASIGGGGGVGGGGDTPGAPTAGFNSWMQTFGRNSPQQFASGGYTGSIGRQNIAGVVHGQEYVMPAEQTAKYRPLLDAMRAGTATTSGAASSGGVNVSVQNYGSSKISVQQLSPNDIRIIAREESVKAAVNDAPRAIANQLNNPNSVISKSLSSNINSKRRR